jgi:ABC-type glycerol-3-phosphate transport system substrate-binding protein
MSSRLAFTRLSRRDALRLLGVGAGVTLLAACGQSAQPQPTSKPAEAPAKPTEAAKPAAPAATTAAAAPAAKPAATTAPAAKPTAAPAAAAQQAPAKTGGTVSLRWFFWTGSEEESQFWQGLAADAAKAVGNVEVKFETDSFANFWTKLPADAASGTVADLIGLQSLRTGGYASRNLYLPLDDLIKDDKSFDVSDFDKTIVDGLSYKGKLYALAYDFGPNIVYLDKTLFQKAGVALPKADWSWNDFVETAKGLSKDIDGQPVRGAAFINQFDRMVNFIFSAGGDYANADFTKSNLSAPETIEGIQYYVDLFWKHKAAAQITDPGNTNADRDQIQAGRAAMYISGPWQFINMRSKMKNDWDIAPLPKGKAGAISWVAGSGFGISSSTKYPKESWEVLKALTSADSLKKVASAGRGYPGRKSAVEAFYKKDALPGHQEVIGEQLKTAKPYRTNPTWQEITQQLQSSLVDPITVEGKPVADTVKAAEPGYQALIDRGAKQA